MIPGSGHYARGGARGSGPGHKEEVGGVECLINAFPQDERGDL